MTDAPVSIVLILRHAHAEKGSPGQDDFDRRLDARGRREAEAAGRWLAASGPRPDGILCSPAARTRETLAGLGDAVPADFPLELYSGDADSYLAAIRNAGTGARTILVVGHNPMVETLAAALVGAGDPAATASLADGMKPATLAAIGFDVALADVADGTGRLLALFVPER